ALDWRPGHVVDTGRCLAWHHDRRVDYLPAGRSVSNYWTGGRTVDAGDLEAGHRSRGAGVDRGWRWCRECAGWYWRAGNDDLRGALPLAGRLVCRKFATDLGDVLYRSVD